MPASSGDLISAAVNHSLAASSNPSEDLENKLIGSAKRVLLTSISYEQTSSYSSNLSVLKTKYVVLKPTNGVTVNSSANIGQVKSKDTPPSGCSSKAANSNGRSKSDAVLPHPKRILFSPEKIQLGWQSKNLPIGSGMVNLGNTCYLNSTLQALYHVPAFVNWLMNDKTHKEKCETTNGLGHTECLICAVYRTLKSSLDNSAASNPIRPHLVYNKLKLICKRLVPGHQEDAHEFLRYLIESMDRSYLRLMQANNLDSYSKETTPLSQIFGGYFRTEVKCLECRYVSVTFQHFQDLLLDIRHSDTLDEALESYFSCERLGVGEEAYKCDKCHRRVAATKQFSVEKPPNVLCIQLKRFGIMGGKNSKHMQVQNVLDLTKYWVHHSSQPTTRLDYRLVSLVSHIGPSTNCGHYTAIGLTSSGQLYLFDDSMVRPVPSHGVSATNTYIIMYELCSPIPSLTGTVSSNCTITRATPALARLTNGSSAPKNSNGQSLPSSHSLVPYANESSDSESEAANKHMSASALKNGYAKESSSCVKYSSTNTSNGDVSPYKTPSSAGQLKTNASPYKMSASPCKTSASPCKTSASPCKTSASQCKTSASLCKTSVSDEKVVVNGWHVTETEVSTRSPSIYSPPQNWDVVDSLLSKSEEKSLESRQGTSSPFFNGLSSKEFQRKPLENGSSSSNPVLEEQKKITNGVKENSRVSNGKSWDGHRNQETVDFLRKTSHQGYGASVSTWDGGRTLVDREAENDRVQQRKRCYEQMYEEELDQGKVKKMKSNLNNYQRNSERDVNGQRNFFQEHQNYKNQWHYNKSRHQNNHYYRTYSNNNHYNRPYQNHLRFQWRR